MMDTDGEMQPEKKMDTEGEVQPPMSPICLDSPVGLDSPMPNDLEDMPPASPGSPEFRAPSAKWSGGRPPPTLKRSLPTVGTGGVGVLKASSKASPLAAKAKA